MEFLQLFDDLSTTAITVGVASIRIVIAFMLVPLFSAELIPPLVRNAIFVSLAIMMVVLQPAIDIAALSVQDWLALFAKEVFIGAAIGVFFGVHLWAFEAAGQIIDTQIGLNMAQVYDPISGHQTTLIGELLARLANYVFVACGGLMLLVGGTMESYALWPIGAFLPDVKEAGILLFESEFSFFFRFMVLISAPALVVLFLVDLCMGLINRDAQQFNVFFLSMPLKMLAAVFVLILSVALLADLLVDELYAHYGRLVQLLTRLLG